MAAAAAPTAPPTAWSAADAAALRADAAAPSSAASAAAAAAAVVTERVLSVASIPTRVLCAAAHIPEPELQVIVVPGNPGDPALYETFVALLHAAFGGRAEVVAVAHAGHDGTEAGERVRGPTGEEERRRACWGIYLLAL